MLCTWLWAVGGEGEGQRTNVSAMYCIYQLIGGNPICHTQYNRLFAHQQPYRVSFLFRSHQNSITISNR